MSVRDLFHDPHVAARDNIVTVMSAVAGALRMPGVVPRLTRTPGRVTSPGPVKPGEHNEEIYGGRLGLTRGELDALAARGVI
jgi:crotonobetainyl-CoA:carnitine CoA-transferase CaiB-like acyl-CoA transferase